MSMPRPEFEGVVGRTYAESEGWWPPLPTAPEGAPNVVIVLLDDVGYAQFGCYGSDIATPCFDAPGRAPGTATRTSTPRRSARRRAPAC